MFCMGKRPLVLIRDTTVCYYDHCLLHHETPGGLDKVHVQDKEFNLFIRLILLNQPFLYGVWRIKVAVDVAR
jgi:hypothetical protein